MKADGASLLMMFLQLILRAFFSGELYQISTTGALGAGVLEGACCSDVGKNGDFAF